MVHLDLRAPLCCALAHSTPSLHSVAQGRLYGVRNQFLPMLTRHLFLSVLAHAFGNVPGYCHSSRWAGLDVKEIGSWQMTISNQQSANGCK
jgi:hypothetical protein